VKKRAPVYGPLVVDGGEFSVLLNPSLALLADVTSGNVGKLIESLRVIVGEHPYTDDDDEPVDIGELDVAEAQAVVRAWTEHLRDLPKA